MKTDHLESARLRGWLGDGLVSASRRVSDARADETRLHVVDARVYPLCEFGEFGLHGDADGVVAGVLTACRGELSGAAFLHMAPEDALAWTKRLAPAADPVATFVEVGDAIMAESIRAACNALNVNTEIGPTKLVEDTVGGCLLATHAPPDTVLIGAKLLVEIGQEGEADEQSFEAFCHLLFDAKIVSAMLRTPDR